MLKDMSPESKMALACVLIYWAILMIGFICMDVLDLDGSEKAKVDEICFDTFGLWQYTADDESGVERMTDAEFTRWCAGGGE